MFRCVQVHGVGSHCIKVRIAGRPQHTQLSQRLLGTMSCRNFVGLILSPQIRVGTAQTHLPMLTRVRPRAKLVGQTACPTDSLYILQAFRASFGVASQIVSWILLISVPNCTCLSFTRDCSSSKSSRLPKLLDRHCLKLVSESHSSRSVACSNRANSCAGALTGRYGVIYCAISIGQC